jgi:putative acetyltransferase
MAMVRIRQARFGGAEDDAALVRTLMREYAGFLNTSVGGEHICAESLEAELAALPGAYAEPAGTVLLAFPKEARRVAAGQAAGCVAFKPLHHEGPASLHEHACEMKRLWVRPEYQKRHIGRQLADALVDAARKHGYTAMYLDTMPATMQAAYSLYRTMGFVPVERYLDNPVLQRPDALEIAYLRKEL